MKLTIFKILFSVFIVFAISSCEDQGYAKYNPETTPSLSMNGEWYIDITDVATGEVQIEHAIHKTFDSNDGKMYITDRIQGSTPPKFTGWWLETKLDVNTIDLTFSATDALNTADGSKVKITEGKIIKNAAKSKDGNAVDSIYFKAVFDYEPTQVLIYSGHRRTGFLEDEY